MWLHRQAGSGATLHEVLFVRVRADWLGGASSYYGSTRRVTLLRAGQCAVRQVQERLFKAANLQVQQAQRAGAQTRACLGAVLLVTLAGGRRWAALGLCGGSACMCWHRGRRPGQSTHLPIPPTAWFTELIAAASGSFDAATVAATAATRSFVCGGPPNCLCRTTRTTKKV